MSNYLRDVLGADNSSSEFAQPQGLVADIGPDLPGGEGANEGFWREQLRDRLGQWAKMFGLVLFDFEIEGIGRVTGHGELVDIVRPGVGLVRIKGHKVLPDGDYEILGDNLEAIDAIIEDEDYERITGKDVTPSTKPTPELKDSITGDEALKTIRSYVTSSLKEEGRFPVIRSDADIEKVVSEQYKSLFPQIQKENPELLKLTTYNLTIPNADLFWTVLSSQFATDLMTMYTSPDQLNPLQRLVNQLYAEKFLGLKRDGLISFYRNNIRAEDTEVDAASGYASLDRYMAFDYNVALGKNEGGPNTGRYEIKAKPDEVNGLLGFSRIGDEIGVVISPEVTSIPGRVTRLGDLEIPDVDSAPWLDLKNIEWDRSFGSSPFRQHKPLGQFDYYGLDKDPFGGGNTWASFYEAHGLEKGAIPQKYDELHGEGAWARDWEDFNPKASYFKALFTEYKDEDETTKWGLKGDALWNIGIEETDLSNPKANDGFEKNIKILSTIQELMGKPFFVSRGHSKDDPRLEQATDESTSEPTSIDDLGIDFQTATMDAGGARLPTPGAFTGKFQEIMEGAKDWKEVQDRLKGQTVTYFDFETTGISNYDGDGIKNDPIQLGAVQVKDGKIIKRFNVYTNPGSKLSEWSADNLKRDVVDENGERVLDENGKPASTLVTPDWLEKQMSPEEGLRQFIEFMGPGALVGGQNVPFDLEILQRMADDAGVKLDIAGTIDSKDLASLLPTYDAEKGIDGPKQIADKETGRMRPSSSLGPVANFLGFEPANWHSADGDAEDSYNLVSKIIDRAANEDNKNLSLLNFPEMEKQYKEKMDAFKASISSDNPTTERQIEALTEFAETSDEAKKALTTVKTRGQAAEVLEKLNSAAPPAAEESKLDAPLTPQSDSIDAPGTAKTIDSLPASKIYGEHRYRPASEIKLDIKSEDGELSSEELQAIDEYMSADYREINAATRMYPNLSGQQMLDSVDPATIKVAGQWTGEEYDLDTTRPFETIQLLDSAFSNSALQEDEVVYRGVHMSPEELQALLNLEVGSTIKDTGYLSTTTNLTLAQEYAERINGTGGNIGPKEGNKAVIYRIKALKGTPATQNQDLERGEDELILARNLNLKITGISKTSKGVVVLDVETQPAESKPETPGERKTGLFNEYDSERADQITAEDTPLTDLGWEPDEEITVYRGVPDDVDSINSGDWVTTLPQLAQDYAGAGGKVVSSKVRARDLFADPSAGEGAYTEEMVYRPRTKDIADQDFIDFSSFEKVSGPLGSNPGGVYKDPKTGEQYYVKIQDEDRGNNERLASAIYKEAGLGSLEVKDGTLDGKPITYTEWRENLIPLFGSQSDKLRFTERQDVLDIARDGYLIDAWIANWDIVGEGLDNISADKDGNPVRLDAGGALLYRARGSKKGDLFGNEVVELDTFRDPSNTAEMMYGSMYLFPRAERESYEKLKAITPERIDQLVDQYISNSSDNQELKNKLKARRQFILDKYEGSTFLTGPTSKLYGSKTTQNISKEEKKAVRSYTDAGYRYINRHLREPENPDYQRYKDDADELNNIINANTLTEDTTLLRVTRNFDEDYQQGDIIEDAAIQSTTKAGRSAIHSTVMDKLYPEDPESVEFVGYTTYTIKAPAGTPALDVTEISQFRSEGEVLLPAGTKFKVVSYERKPVSEFGGSYRNITVEVVSSVVPVSKDAEPSDPPKKLQGKSSKSGEASFEELEELSVEPTPVKIEDLSADEGYSLEFYSRGLDETSRKINTFLQMDRVFDRDALEYDFLDEDSEKDVVKTKSELNSVVDNINNAIYKHGKLNNPTTLYRGVGENIEGMLENLSVGDTISEPGFSSTALDPKIARHFANDIGRNGVLFKINAPKGSYGLRLGDDLVPTFSNNDKSKNGMEGSEVLLPSGTKFKIVSIKKELFEAPRTGKYLYSIEVDVIPQEKKIVKSVGPVMTAKVKARKTSRLATKEEVDKMLKKADNLSVTELTDDVIEQLLDNRENITIADIKDVLRMIKDDIAADQAFDDDWNPLTGLETATEKKERIEPGFENWNKEVEKIFEDWDNDLVGDADNSSGNAGNTLQANFILKAGFNGKPKVLSQEEFDSIEEETVYRGQPSSAFVRTFLNSELQFAGEGYFGNGTYTSNRRDTAEQFAGAEGIDWGVSSPTKAEMEERILEMKMLPDANVLSFEEVTDLREWADQKTREFLEGYEKSGANPAQYQEAEWRLFNEADYTNIAIMLGIDAIRFAVPLTDKEEYYTIILNRGKVAVNGKS